MRWATAILMTAAMLAIAPGAIASELYVDDDAPEGGDGLTWATAHRQLQDALAAAAASGGAVTEIRIGQGTYLPDRGAERAPGDRDEAFGLMNGVAVRGGYAGIGATDPDARDIAAFETILSGDILGNDGAEFANSDENSYQVVVAVDVDDTAWLEGVTVSGARADGPHHGASPESKDQGGAVNVYFSQPRLVDCTFRDNWQLNHGTVNDHGDTTLIRCTFRDNHSESFGGGLYSHLHAATQVIDCTFINNTTPVDGGGAYNKGSRHVVYTGCHFEGNQAARGAALYGKENSLTTLAGCTFTDNVAPKGGAIYGDFADATLVDCTFTGNVASGEGGGGIWFERGVQSLTACMFVENVAFHGGGLYNKLSVTTVTGCSFIGNTANDGGGVWNEGEPISFTDCTFTGNVGETGGGLYNEDSNAIIVGCDFTNNTAAGGDGGGGVTNAFESNALVVDCAFTGNTSVGGLFNGGGAMANYIGLPTIRDCTFTRNTTLFGGGAMYNELFDAGELPTVVDCSFHGNTAGDGGAVQNFRSSPWFMNCVFVGNEANGEFSGFGGAIDNWFQSFPTFTNCTFTANTAIEGGGLSSRDSSDPLITNSVVWGNPGGEIVVGPFGSSYVVRHSSVLGGIDGPGNIDGDPVFVEVPTPGADGDWGTEDDDYGDLRLGIGSTCVDAGSNGDVPRDGYDLDTDDDLFERTPRDLAGAPRFADVAASANTGCGAPAIVDMGAYEQVGASAAIRVGDLDANGVVGSSDLLTLIGAWGACGEACCPADIDRNGVVEFADLLRQIAAWGS
ncbi:MAG: right-handed parallel beta-helix repeat-containing protein [Planctomycetes bacterium]|nr:right-handed parallel beta-helix repeat-containing protein [Planctomycetota bacterium]